MKDLIILGSGVHGAEMAQIVERIKRISPTWNLRGFISAREDAGCAGARCAGYPLLGPPRVIGGFHEAVFVPDNEFPEPIGLPRDRLVSLIDPSTFVSHTARIGPGSVVYPNGFIGLNVVLGYRVFCLSGSVINHDDRIEDRVVLCSDVSLAGSVHVEEGCYLGQACTVRQHLRIGRGSLIGMGSVVVKDVPPESVMAGNPARRLRTRDGSR